MQAEQTRALFRNCPIGVISAALVAWLLATTLHDASGQPVAGGMVWSGLVAACAAAHLLLCLGYRRHTPGPAQWRPWYNAFSAIVLVEGLVWCIGTICFLADGDELRALVVLLAWSGVIAGAIIVFGAFLRTYLLFVYPSMGPHIWFLWHHNYRFSDTVLALVLVYMLALPLIVYRLKLQTTEGHRLRFENLELANDMRQQKDRADQANLAKSRFLASASHDLRQPVHALSLFIGALRSRTMDTEARHLVDHIDDSVTAMDDLFTSLLDISKLDAGTMQPVPASVSLGPLLTRLCSDYGSEANAKGVALRRVETTLWARTDPVLLERILRNLIANAVRYTDSGGVVVGCRRREGTVAIEIRDSGCGIAANVQERVFEEFFQVGNPERDRSKGLGLGLAIVRRLSVLIDAPLSFWSEPGRGSLFRIELPRSDVTLANAPDFTTADGIPEPGRALIAVVDDEGAIRLAMESLLLSWGHDAVAAASGDELMARLGRIGARPDLIICDYRLRGDETGVAVIAAVRAHCRAAIPAMLITGDTAPDRILEAEASGFLLLHKPLSNARLRAAVGNLLRGRAA